jgi:hypothetical protein
MNPLQQRMLAALDLHADYIIDRAVEISRVRITPDAPIYPENVMREMTRGFLNLLRRALEEYDDTADMRSVYAGVVAPTLRSAGSSMASTVSKSAAVMVEVAGLIVAELPESDRRAATRLLSEFAMAQFASMLGAWDS